MAAPPLTHHDILGLVEPFSRRGRQVDLAASNRIERRLVFKAVLPDTDAPALAGAQENLQLELLPTGTSRLTRELRRPDGLTARLHAMGPSPADLLAAVEAVPAERFFTSDPAFMIARSYSLERARKPAAGRDAWVLGLTHAAIELEDLRFTLALSPVKGVSADVTLAPTRAGALELPEDLLAVLGWDWARLINTKEGWKSKLRLRGELGRRTRTAERSLETAAMHLARTLAEPPGRFHDRRRAARWGVVFRRAIPLLTFVALLIGVASLARRGTGRVSELWILFFHVPTVLIALSFCVQELPQYEIPPLPRRSLAPTWYRRVEVPETGVEWRI
jgi:hypothetical protein